jgi:uncharacterized protein YndB with AHSA1/START domain
MPTLEAASTAVSTPIVEITRVVRTSRARLYQAWTDADSLKQWFGPADMHCSSVDLDPRIGGAYIARIVHNADPARPEATASGHFTKLVADKLLQFTWKPSWNPGEDSLVTVSFRDAAGGAEITIRHENFDQSAVPSYNQGWIGCLDKMEVALSQ